jgi:hypothetical protein
VTWRGILVVGLAGSIAVARAEAHAGISATDFAEVPWRTVDSLDAMRDG